MSVSGKQTLADVRVSEKRRLCLLCQIGTLSRFKKRKKFRRCLFTSSIKHDVRQFSNVVVVVFFIKPIADFFTFSLLLPSSDRKVPKEREQH